MDTILAFPSIVFIPWKVIQLPGMLNGLSFNRSHPVYWAKVPQTVPLIDNVVFPVTVEMVSSEYLPYELLHSFWEIQQAMVLLGPSEALEPLMSRFKTPEVRDNAAFPYTLHHFQGKAFAYSSMYYFQKSPDSEVLSIIKAEMPFLNK